MRRRVLVLVLVALAMTGPAAAQIYRWTDEQGTAHYVDGIDNVPERYRARAVPLGLRNSPAGAPPGDPAPAGALAGAPADATRIRYEPGGRILVDVTLNGRSSARLLLDTGADRTMIDPRSLVAAGAPLDRPVARGEVQGVSGRQEVSWFVLDSLEVAGMRIERIAVAAHGLETREADGLLGRDVLDRFHVAIDAARGILTLTPR